MKLWNLKSFQNKITSRMRSFLKYWLRSPKGLTSIYRSIVMEKATGFMKLYNSAFQGNEESGSFPPFQVCRATKSWPKCSEKKRCRLWEPPVMLTLIKKWRMRFLRRHLEDRSTKRTGKNREAKNIPPPGL